MTTTHQTTWLDELQSLVTNSLNLEALRGRRVAGILGDVPSTYAKSPRLWNRAFQALGLEAAYVPLDVPRDRLREVLRLLRSSEMFLGGSVTVPYKIDVMPLLDEVDPLTSRIGAVNVVTRTPDGRLVGYNTDGLGGVRALTDSVLPGHVPPVADLTAARVLLLGAGGAAQALAFHLWEQMTQGELLIANRTRSGAELLAQRLSAMRSGCVAAVREAEVPTRAPDMTVVINATVKGQAGIRKLADGRWTCLEPYSALGLAQPAALPPVPPGAEGAFLEAWYRRSAKDIQHNHDESLEACARLPRRTLCYDVIYAPLETMFLHHARWSGHATLSGKAMNVAQALEAFMRYVCREWLLRLGWDTSKVSHRVAQAMAEEWSK
jgi:shikimate dehydrogenase